MSRSKSRSTPDQRSGARFEIPLGLRGEVTVVQPVVIKAISAGGAEVEAPFRFQLDSLHDFRLSLGSRTIVLKGRVVHSSIRSVEPEQVVYRSGVDFVEPPDRVADVLRTFIDAIRRERNNGS